MDEKNGLHEENSRSWQPSKEADWKQSASGGAAQRRSRVQRAGCGHERAGQPAVHTPVSQPYESFSDFSGEPSWPGASGPYISGVPLPNQHTAEGFSQQKPQPRCNAPFAQDESHHDVREIRTPQVGQQQKQDAKRTVNAQAARRSFIFSRLLLAVCVLVFAVSAFLLIRYFANILVTRRASVQLEEVYQTAVQSAETEAPPAQTPVPTSVPAVKPVSTQIVSSPNTAASPSANELWPDKYPGNPMLRVSSVFYELQRQNPDIIGWLKIDGVLEEAVVQRDNEYYLTHNALRQKSVTGALFLDEKCDLKTVPGQMLIHGHNMKEGAMFGSLKKYKVKDASFYRAHPYIEFNTIYENSTYVIFAVAEVDLRRNKGDYLPFWEDVRFRSAQSFMDYVHKARDLSHYRCNVDVVPGDRLLTLSTCTGNDDNKRLVVMARRLRDNEDKLQLNMSIMSTDDR